MYNIAIIEDHPVMREGLASWFANTGRWHVLGTAATLAEAKEFLAENKLQIDIILLDIQLPDGWGLDIISQLQKPKLAKQAPALAVYSSFDDYSHVSAALSMGVQAYVTKQRTNQELEAALLQALNGEAWIDDTARAHFENTDNLLRLLSKRETEIVKLVKSGLSNKQIADQLGISRRTVENTLFCVYDKTGIHSRLELERL